MAEDKEDNDVGKIITHNIVKFDKFNLELTKLYRSFYSFLSLAKVRQQSNTKTYRPKDFLDDQF